MYQSDGKLQVWRKSQTTDNLLNTASSVKYGLCGVMACACLSANRTGFMMFIDDVSNKRQARMNTEVYICFFERTNTTQSSFHIWRRFYGETRQCFPKHSAKATQNFKSSKNVNILDSPSQSPDLNTIEHSFHISKLKIETLPTNSAQLKAASPAAWTVT